MALWSLKDEMTSPEKEVEMVKRAAVVRYKENPFLDDMDISTRKKQVRVRAMGKDSDISIINHETGELSGTQLVTYKQVDDEEFVKLFAKNLALTFDLTAAGNKALFVLIWVVQYKAIEKDIVPLDKFTHEDFVEAHANNKKPLMLSITTFTRGINELEKARIIAKSRKAGEYYINPSFVFNGDRVAFTKIIERKKAVEIGEQNE